MSARSGVDHYPVGVSLHTQPSGIPVEALARRTRLQAVLQAMEAAGSNLEPTPLQALRAMIVGRPTMDSESLLVLLADADLAEESSELLRANRRESVDGTVFGILSSRLVPFVVKARQRRSASWQLDSRRALVRLHYAKEGAALGFDDGDLHAIFLQAFRLEGLRVALDLGKRPRPILTIGLPLPAGVGGLTEGLDVLLRREPAESPEVLLARLNRRLPEGLRIHQWTLLPGYATGLGELALKSHWCWDVPMVVRGCIETGVSAFLAAATWPWDRGGAKAGEPLNLRNIVGDVCWDEGALCFSTLMGDFNALSPLKVLSGIFGMDPIHFTGLVRTAVALKPDPRLGHAERFEAKLKNMYEDAVLLGGSSNIVLIDEDDDEPIRLGPPSETS